MNAGRGIGKFADGERRRVLAELRSGKTPAETAEAVGRSLQFLTARARTDGELRLALEGAPVAAQRLARKGDYLAALARTGSIAAASREIGAVGHPPHWRSDPDFRAAEEAVLRMAGTHGVERPCRPPATAKQLDMVAQELEAGESMHQACVTAGVQPKGLRRRADLPQRLRDALPPPRRQPVISGRRKAELMRRLPELWGDPSLSVSRIAELLEISSPTVVKYAGKLGLPRQRA
ncbi:hypothetical protein [Streptomyces sp. NPDC007355]|uniref:hypothetical protein n=1 Tax=Streptomyces sp. NPDC007355 TaxID=3364778 RepID=UPI0036A83951